MRVGGGGPAFEPGDDVAVPIGGAASAHVGAPR
jgi:hypothetical protein